MSILDPKQDAAALQPLEDKALDSLRKSSQEDIQLIMDGLTKILDSYKITVVFEKK